MDPIRVSSSVGVDGPVACQRRAICFLEQYKHSCIKMCVICADPVEVSSVSRAFSAIMRAFSRFILTETKRSWLAAKCDSSLGSPNLPSLAYTEGPSGACTSPQLGRGSESDATYAYRSDRFAKKDLSSVVENR